MIRCTRPRLSPHTSHTDPFRLLFCPLTWPRELPQHFRPSAWHFTLQDLCHFRRGEWVSLLASRTVRNETWSSNCGKARNVKFPCLGPCVFVPPGLPVNCSMSLPSLQSCVFWPWGHQGPHYGTGAQGHGAVPGHSHAGARKFSDPGNFMYKLGDCMRARVSRHVLRKGL